MQSFTAVINRLKISLTSSQLGAFDLYASRLLEENHRASLTSDNTREALYHRHFAESLSLLCGLEELDLVHPPVIDIGSGGGFPGIPIKIARPDLPIVLCEATAKKTRFLESVSAELGLSDVTVIQARAEDLGRDPDHREHYPLALARALAPLPVLLEVSLPLVTVGGILAAPKGSAGPRELEESTNALTTLGAEVEETRPLQVEGANAPMTLILIRKTSPTPDRYPRRPGIPRKRPL
jgi:16S rRNA (guanine527-N7)-methyltransferase